MEQVKSIGKQNILLLLGFVVIVIGALFLYLVPAPGQAPETNGVAVTTEAGYTAGNCVADECLAVKGLRYPVVGIDDMVARGLLDSLTDTYQTTALYSLIMAELGEGQPFINIIRTEQHYLAAQKALFDKYGFIIPDNNEFENVMTPEGLTPWEACALALEREEASVELYEGKLLALSADYPDLLKVYGAINRASVDLHIPALRGCSQAPDNAPNS